MRIRIAFSSFIMAAMLFATIPSVAQNEVRYSVGVHYGSYAMKDLKGLQSEFLAQLAPIPVKATDEFPNFVGFEGSVVWINRRIARGIDVGYNSTGGRIAYSDYSGKLLVDQLVSAPRIGFTSFVILNNEEKPTEFVLFLNAGFSHSTYKLKYHLELDNQPDVNDNLMFNSTNVYFSVGPGITHKFKHAFISLKLLYQFDACGKLLLSTDHKYHLQNGQGEKVTVDWSGFRAGIVLGLK